MLLKRFYDDKLAQASYLIACQATGDAIVIDPNRDIAQYTRAAEQEGVRVRYVTETHIHADFVSGARELAAATGATLLLSDEGGDDWHYAFAQSDHARLLHHGDVVHVGNITLDVIHTPGHTPEHISFVVTDGAATDRPMGAITGDFIFVGDVGRPDLLERAANMSGTMEAGARALYASLQRFSTYPDYLQLWPGHGAGSACGKALGAVPSTTLGYEKIANWAFAPQTEGEFVAHVLAGQPEPPKYFGEMKRINREGPLPLGALTAPPLLDANTLSRVVASDAFVVDTRPAADFASRFVPGTINIPLGRSFTNWAGSLIPFDRDFYLIIDDSDARHLAEAQRNLAMIGLDRLVGYFATKSVLTGAYREAATGHVRQMSATELAAARRDNAVHVIDVRGAAEWNEGHIPGAVNIPLGTLADHLDELTHDRPVVLHCQGGGRSSIGASILKAHGFEDVVNLVGGFGEWSRAGNPVERPRTNG